jgi:NADH-quinone oxidoreductase subunit G
MTKMVKLTIDGHEVEVPEGTLIVDAAKMAGIDIPVFCYHPKMEPVGMCRMCLVEIGRPVRDRNTGRAARRGLGADPVRPQARDRLHHARLRGHGRGGLFRERSKPAPEDILEFLLTSHPLDCPICDKGGECPLQNLTMALGPGRAASSTMKSSTSPSTSPGRADHAGPRALHPMRPLHPLPGSEIVDDPVIGFFQRGRALEIVTFSEPGFDSVFLGQHHRYLPGRRPDHG